MEPRKLVFALSALTGPGRPLGPGTAEAAVGPTVSSWVTTPDRSRLLARGESPTFSTDGPRPGQMITVDPGRTFQTMDGFGASITDSSAALLYRLPAAQHDEVLRSIFHPDEGIGMSFLRQPIGSSDFVDEPHYTYNDLPPGQTDYEMTRFSIAHDEAQILPLLRRALELNPDLKVMASPWGQPAWMKANGSLFGGRLIDDPAIYRAYARYLVRFVQAYEAAGVPIYALIVQNEPQNRTPDGYPGTDMPVAQQAAVINELGPQLRDAGLGRVKIISYDHNWAEHPDDIADAQALGVDPEPNYPSDILRSSAARRTPRQRWLRQQPQRRLHRRGDGRRHHGHEERRVLRARAHEQVRPSRRGADRLGEHRRPPQRGLPQPGRLDRAGGEEHRRRDPDVRRLP